MRFISERQAIEARLGKAMKILETVLPYEPVPISDRLKGVDPTYFSSRHVGYDAEGNILWVTYTETDSTEGL